MTNFDLKKIDIKNIFVSDKNTLFIFFFFIISFVLKTILFSRSIATENYGLTTQGVFLYVGIGLFCGSFSLLSKNKYGLFVFSLLYDIWLLSNLWYFRSYNDILTHWNLQCVRNLDGMWSSIFTYMQASDFIYIGLTIALLALCIFFSPKDSHKKGFFVLAGISVIFCIVMLIFQVNHFKKKPYVIEKLSYNIFDSKFDCPCHKADFIGNRYYAVYFSPFLYFVNQIHKTVKDNKTEINLTKEEYDKNNQKTDCKK